MNFFRLLPVIISFLLLGAHFYRAGEVVLVGLCLAVPFLAFVPRPWVPRVLQVLLLAGAIEWLYSAYFIATMRIAWNQPWNRLVVILGLVALFTALSGLVFEHGKLKARYRRGNSAA